MKNYVFSGSNKLKNGNKHAENIPFEVYFLGHFIKHMYLISEGCLGFVIIEFGVWMGFVN